MILQNNKGSTLIENVVAMFLLSMFCLMVFVSLIARVNALREATAMEDSINEAYNTIEETLSAQSADTSATTVTNDVTLSFQIVGDTSRHIYQLEGDFVVAGDDVIGEFKS